MIFEPDEIDPELARDYACEGAVDLIESMYEWGFDDVRIIEVEHSWHLYMYGFLIACGVGEDPITAMDNLYQRVVEIFVSEAIQA